MHDAGAQQYDDESKELRALVKEFFEVLNSEEESDSGRIFHPVYVSSVRVMLTKRLNEIMPRMEAIVKT